MTPNIAASTRLQSGSDRSQRAEIASVQHELATEKEPGQQVPQQAVAIVRAAIDDEDELGGQLETLGDDVRNPRKLRDERRNELLVL